MRSDLPTRLYKYLHPDRADILRVGRLRYSPFGAFNDPFEGFPDVATVHEQNEGLLGVKSHILDEMPRILKRVRPWFQETMTFNQVLGLTTFAAQSSTRAEERPHSVAPLLLDFMTGDVDSKLGVLCLSEVPDSLLMWSHYAASHEGFVVEFDAHHPYFHAQRSDNDDFGCVRRVFYRDARSCCRAADLSAAEIFLTKSSQWSYEREWRVLRDFADADETINASPYPLHLFAIPPAAITAVIVGARATAGVEATLTETVRARKDLAHVAIRRARASAKHFMIEFHDAKMVT